MKSWVVRAIPIALLGVVAGNAIANPSTQTSGKGFDLTRLSRLHDHKTPEEAADLYLTFLREEVTKPSPVRMGVGGAPITHEYVLAQIVLAGAEAKVDTDCLWRVRTGIKSGEERDAITITLGLLGDRRVVPELIQYASDWNHSPFIRERAVRALESVPDSRAVPVLAATLDDPFWVEASVGPERKVYVNRMTARSVLKRYQSAGVYIPDHVIERMRNLVINEHARK